MPKSDYGKWYARISAPWRLHPGAVRLLNILDKGLVYAIAVCYIACLAWLAASGDNRFILTLAVPAIEFVLCTALRAGMNRPRPYEQFSIDPLIRKDTQGKSFPSRHISSAVIIACALFWLQPVAGIVAFAASAIVCYCRIVGGVHFPRDVAGAVALALACGLVGFVLIP
ncbi:MAG: phosphatase PAP2 family protein [Eggerthellaceae bacterium]|jgi:phosphatidylglycerophosphatase B